MDDLLKEAIADAKAVRETALANAKIALEEAFTPKLQSMLSKKIQQEEDGEELEGGDDDEAEEAEVEAEEPEGEKEVDIDVGDDEEVADEMMSADETEGEEDEVPAEEGGYEEDEEGGEEEDDLDLEAIIRELEDEEGAEEEPEVEESNDVSSGIGSGDNSQPSAGSSDDNSDDPEGESGAPAEAEDSAYEEGEDAEHSPDLEEVIDLDDVLKALSEEEGGDDDDDDDDDEVQAENTKLKSALGEHRKVVKYLKSKLNEVNLLNAKLLFTNKLFKSHNLSNDQKIKVVETFDRAQSLREVKLVFSTLAESFGYAGNIKKSAVYESASKAVPSTKPKKKVISEGKDMADRFKKLAGLIK